MARTATAHPSGALRRTHTKKTGRTGGGLYVRAQARVLRWRLDGLIARAVDRPRDRALALREAQLRGAAERGRVSRELRRVLHESGSPPRFSAAVPTDRRAVRNARPALEQLIRSLESQAEVDARGVAIASRLLTDACSPLFLPPNGAAADGEALHREVCRALLALQPIGAGIAILSPN